NIIKEFRNLAYQPTTTPVSKSPQNVKVFPNPTSGNLNIEVTPLLVNAPYEIFSFNGQKVSNGIFNQSVQTIQTEGWSKGQYFLRASNNMGTITKTFVVN
ncbi:MAG: T9SS type A sorting domain-containing protein, partial [Bacteroidetes bacterium]|nr:T9SS type A sorting domain-containing protein [Bacteroidota bacterium]